MLLYRSDVIGSSEPSMLVRIPTSVLTNEPMITHLEGVVRGRRLLADFAAISCLNRNFLNAGFERTATRDSNENVRRSCRIPDSEQLTFVRMEGAIEKVLNVMYVVHEES
jgi:hypothetical protein